MNKILLLGTLGLSTALAACSYDDNPGTDAGNGSGADVVEGDGSTRPELAECEDNVDCRGGEVCRDGFCRESCSTDDPCQGELSVCSAPLSYCVQCAGSEGCDEGERCVADWCEFFCTADEHCPSDRYCDFPTGECFVPECYEDAECSGGERCSDLRCVPIDAPIDDTCRGDADCDRGEFCDRGECVPLDGPECTGNAQCDAGEVCLGGQCLPEEDICTGDADCRGGERCEAGACVPIEIPDCVSASDCDEGETCRDGECVPVSTSECTSSAQCSAGEECIFGSCIPVTTPPECESDLDCFVTEVCRDGACVPRGTTENVCPIVSGGCRVRSGGGSFASFVVAQPGDVIECSGAGSYDPDGTISTFAWSMTSRPAASSARFSSTSARDTSFTADVDGSYSVQLSAVDNAGLASCSVLDVSIVATRESSALRVQLTWDTPGDRDQTDNSGADMDIYLRDASRTGCWTSTTNVCNYAEKTPDWGTIGDRSDDPELEIDDVNGTGPEQISYANPPAGTYEVGVHYYNDNEYGESTATVRVYVDGELVFERSRVMTDLQFWSVAAVRFNERTVRTIDTLSATREAATCP